MVPTAGTAGSITALSPKGTEEETDQYKKSLQVEPGDRERTESISIQSKS